MVPSRWLFSLFKSAKDSSSRYLSLAIASVYNRKGHALPSVRVDFWSALRLRQALGRSLEHMEAVTSKTCYPPQTRATPLAMAGGWVGADLLEKGGGRAADYLPWPRRCARAPTL
eukprot:6076126-Pleurochrysis_carterae.AAC.1